MNSTYKGRGASSNAGSRYLAHTVEFDDGIDGPSPVTECIKETAKTIIATNRSPDVPFDQSLNPYRGCEHGCIYCYARPTHAWLDLSPGLDFETRLRVKHNAAERLEAALRAPGYQCRPITVGANTDPYQPVEREHRVTRQCLEVLQRFRHPFSIITRSTLVERDIDLLAEMAGDGLCSVAMSVTTLDRELKRRMEPRAPSGEARLQTMAALSERGIPVSLLLGPVIPALNDHELETIVERAAGAGARAAAYILLRLPLEVGPLFEQWLQQHYPLKARHVMSLVRQQRGGRDYDTRFGHRMRGTGPFAELLSQRFKRACRAQGLDRREQLNTRSDLFQVPPQRGDQMGLFDG